MDFGRWRSISGLVDGAQTPTEWTISTARSQPTAEKQAQFEADAEERKKLSASTTGRQRPAPRRTSSSRCSPRATSPVSSRLPTSPSWTASGASPAPRVSSPVKASRSCPARTLRRSWRPFFVADPDLVLDGELYNHALRADFEKISSFVRKQEPNPATAGVVQYHVYDIPSFDGTFSSAHQFTTRCCKAAPI
ncbi:hypothetical protein NKK48_01135 [Mesorhizobium sp. C386A]|uniref:hypothetical protein n=1 Tax=Mesorhizobium sp. C386A TaxID=2956831 RepID=UPI00333B9682